MGALDDLARGDLAAWQGLPDSGPAELAAALGGPSEPPGSGLLSGVRAPFRTYRAPAQPEEVWAWFDDRDRARLVVLEWPALVVSAPELLAALGPPEHKLDPAIGHHKDAFQWIWASRGLTLYVREWRDDGPEIARASAYRPTTVADYVDNLGASDETRYH